MGSGRTPTGRARAWHAANGLLLALTVIVVAVPAASAATPPNIVVIVTDDQRAGMLDWMPATTRLLVERGTRTASRGESIGCR